MSVPHRFPHRYDIGDDIFALQLEPPPMFPHPAETDLDLIGYADSSRFSNMLVHLPEVIGWGDDLPAAA